MHNDSQEPTVGVPRTHIVQCRGNPLPERKSIHSLGSLARKLEKKRYWGDSPQKPAKFQRIK